MICVPLDVKKNAIVDVYMICYEIYRTYSLLCF